MPVLIACYNSREHPFLEQTDAKQEDSLDYPEDLDHSREQRNALWHL